MGGGSLSDRRHGYLEGRKISIPAAIRHRWGTSTVILDDQGGRLVIEPAPDDPIAAAEGALATEYGGMDVARLRTEARADELIASKEGIATLVLPSQG